MSRLINPWVQHDGPTLPYAGGTVYFGLPNQDPIANPKAPFSDSALLVPIGEAQTLDSKGMYQTAIFLKGAYSMSLFDSDNNFIRTDPDVLGNSGAGSKSKKTVSDMTSDVAAEPGDFYGIADYATGNGSGVLFFSTIDGPAPAPDGGSQIDHDTLNLHFLQNFPSSGIYVEMFGGNAAVDIDVAFNNAIEYCYTQANRALHFKARVYTSIAVLTVKQGVKLIGDESQGSTEQFGSTFLIKHNGNGIHYSGVGADFAGTGAGLKHFKVFKDTAFNGGEAILVDGTDINKRHGEMEFHDVLITANGAGSWGRGMHFDGTAYTTAGSKGIRSVNINKVRITDCTQNDGYALLDQVTHFTSTHFQIDQGGGSGTPGLTIDGDSENVLFANAIINGNLAIASSCTMNGFVFNGRCATFSNSSTAIDGYVGAQIAGAIANSSQNLNIISSDESFLKNLNLNNTSGADDELLTLKNSGTDQGALGTLGAAIVTLKPLVVSGETHVFGTNGAGLERSVQVQYTRFKPSADNVMDLGNGSFRWAVVYAGTGTINTSDERDKKGIKDIDNLALDAWSNVKFKQYNWKEGDERIYFGAIAQQIIETFNNVGLNALDYGLLDLSGGRYGVRYDQCMILELELVRRRLNELES